MHEIAARYYGYMVDDFLTNPPADIKARISMENAIRHQIERDSPSLQPALIRQLLDKLYKQRVDAVE